MIATAGATSTTPAATSPDATPGPARPVPRLHLLGIRHHGPGSARSVVRALDELRPTSCSSRRRPTPTTRCAGSATPASCRRWPCSATSSPSPSGPCSRRSPSSARSGRRCAGRSRNGAAVEAIDLPLGADASPGRRRRADAAARRGAARRPARRPRRRRRRARRRAVVGGPRRAPRRRRAGVRRRRRGDGRGARRHGDRPPFDALREAHMRRRIRAGARRRPASSPSCAGPGTCPALDPSATTNAADAAALRGQPKVKVAVTWVPWTHRRLRPGDGLRRRRRQPRLVRPRLPPSRPGGRLPVLRRRRPRPAPPRACRRRPTT